MFGVARYCLLSDRDTCTLPDAVSSADAQPTSSAPPRAAAARCCASCSPAPGSPGGPRSTSRRLRSSGAAAPAARVLRRRRGPPRCSSCCPRRAPRPRAGATSTTRPRRAARRAATTPNGVFGAKLMWSYMADLLARLGRAARPRAPQDARARFGPARATSATCTCAATTRSPRRSRCGARCRPAPGAPARDRRRVEPRLLRLGRSSTSSRQLDRARRRLARAGSPRTAIEPLRGRLRGRSPRTRGHACTRSLDYLGAATADASVPDPPMRRQGDDALGALGRRATAARGGPRDRVRRTAPVALRGSRPRRSTSCARSPPSSSGPCCCSRGGKDSIVLLRLAEKAFRPAPLPVPGPARRHGPQLPRGARVPRPPRRRSSASG